MKRLIFLTLFVLGLGTLWGAHVYAPKKEVPEVKTTPVSQTVPVAAPVETPAEPQATVEPQTPIDATYTALDTQLLDLTNRDRAANGLPALTFAADLDTSAMNKCQDMLAKGYWAHDPPGGSWVAFLPTRYWAKGENLAKEFYTPLQAEKAWMNSPTHKANILGNFTNVGFAQCGNLYVAHFGHN